MNFNSTNFMKICEMKVVICTRDSTKVLKASLSLNPGDNRGQGLEKSQSSSSLNSSSNDRGDRGGSAPPRRYQVYVGNLTWWTTDADIADAVLSVGVNDFVEVKFYENRANGQSKGNLCF